MVADSSIALGIVAANFYDNPSDKLKLVGVTGTNGKTTIATLLYKLFRDLGYKCGLLSTVENQINGEVVAATHTTPDPVELNMLLDEMVSQGLRLLLYGSKLACHCAAPDSRAEICRRHILKPYA